MKKQPSFENSLNSSTLPLDDPSNLQVDQTIITQHKIQKYVNDKKELYDTLLIFFEDSENSDQYLQKLTNFINQFQEEEKKETFEQFLNLITELSNNYHRDDIFLKKIFQILKYYENQIKQTFSNFDIYNIFQNNKLILLFLLDNKIIIIDDKIYQELMTKTEINGLPYYHFFYPEIKEFIGEQKTDKIKEELFSINSKYIEFDYFNEKRHIGENDSYICHLIRQDSVEDFIPYVNRTCISLTSQITPSIFETNSFLNESSPTLIEYAAFFGSIQIFQYLLLSINDSINPKVWLYVIHSKNPELIQILENRKIQPDDEYEKCFIESIKCHHNDFADYINENYYDYDNDQGKEIEKIESDNDDPGKREEIISNVLHYHNYRYFPTDFVFGYELFYLCRYNYNTLVDLFMKRNEKEKKIGKDHLNSFKRSVFNDKIEIIYYLMSRQTRIEDNCFQNDDILCQGSDDHLYKIAIPSSITSIGKSSFYNCKLLTQVVIPSSVTSIGRSAFSQCLALTQIDIPSSVTSIEEFCFYKCSNLSRIVIPSSVTSIGKHSFFECTSLTQILIPLAVKSIENFTFSFCTSLKQVILHSSLLEIKDSAFSECTSLNQISLPSSLIFIGNWSFAGCTSLQQINIPSSVTSLGNGLFSGCSSLAQINIPSSVTSIGSCSFYKCTSLTQISLPPSITSIESCLFYGCTSLIDIKISSSITKIGLMAFYGCSSLKSNLTELVPIEKIGTFAFYGCSSIDSNLAQINSFENIDDYEIKKELIGKGGFTFVLKCNNKKTGQEFALKSYQNMTFTVDQFLEQIAISHIPYLAKVQSFRLPLTNAERNNVKTLHTSFKVKGKTIDCDHTSYITFSEVMENGYLVQITNEYLKNQKVTEKMNPTIRSKLIFGVASIMKHLHKMNIIHRDLKINKILLDDKLEPIIINSTLSTFNTNPCNMQMAIGTPYCMAPEIFVDGLNYYSYPLDVFAFAILMYMMFSSKIVFSEFRIRSSQQYMMKIARNFRPQRPENIPDHYWELIQKCWQQDPDDRPTFEEIVNILKDDKFALEEFGVKTDLDQLHEYQKRIDNDFF